MTTKRRKILYAASTASHLRRFHMPYIERLRAENDVFLMGTAGEGIDFPIDFAKSFFSLSNLRAIRKIRKLLKRERFDRVIVNTTLAAFLIRAAMIGMKRRPYVLNVVHGYLFSESDRGLKAKILLQCEKILRKKTDTIAVMNEEDLRIARAHRLCRGEVIFMRGMGIPQYTVPQTRDDSLYRTYAPADSDVLCVFVGELSARKNQAFLIRAIARLREEKLPVRLLLLGEGSAREALETQIREAGLEDSVFLAGNREPILPYLSLADVYVSASTIEGLPFNIMEAMACGLPIVMSDVKGQHDLKSADDEAILYPLADMDAFCAAVKEACGRARLGIGACAYPQLEQYRLPSVLEENLSILLRGENHENQA
ncbi:MAG: glycosyltransferase [Clostridia bacterium]|nr:glycosyltransferase [Clostridia bacterium]MBQ9806714.1 glycosyltransferase [Clostridia bacterium]